MFRHYILLVTIPLVLVGCTESSAPEPQRMATTQLASAAAATRGQFPVGAATTGQPGLASPPFLSTLDAEPPTKPVATNSHYSREVQISGNPAPLLPTDSKEQTSARVQLLDGLVVTIEAHKVTPLPSGGYWWAGAVKGYPYSVVDLTLTATTVEGGIQLNSRFLPNGGRYVMQIWPNGKGFLRELRPQPADQ